MRDFVVRIRAYTAMQFSAPVVKGLPPASQPLLNWKLREYAAHRRDSDPNDLRNDSDPPEVVPEIPKYAVPRRSRAAVGPLCQRRRAGRQGSDYSGWAAQTIRSFVRPLCLVFPDTFYVTERGRYFPDDSEDKGRY